MQTKNRKGEYRYVRYVLLSYALFEKAAWLTLRLGLAGIALAIVIGLVCALVQYYKVPVLRRVVGFYIQLSRNTPLLVQLFFIYYGCLLYTSPSPRD